MRRTSRKASVCFRLDKVKGSSCYCSRDPGNRQPLCVCVCMCVYARTCTSAYISSAELSEIKHLPYLLSFDS